MRAGAAECCTVPGHAEQLRPCNSDPHKNGKLPNSEKNLHLRLCFGKTEAHRFLSQAVNGSAAPPGLLASEVTD